MKPFRYHLHLIVACGLIGCILPFRLGILRPWTLCQSIANLARQARARRPLDKDAPEKDPKQSPESATKQPECVHEPDRDAQRDAYVQSIDARAACRLASAHHDMAPCHEFRESQRGSFNLCFFVTFPSDQKQWVVRFPIQPMLHDAWGKLQGEVATMRYIKRKTTIPIPEVIAYGKSHEDDGSGVPFIILEYISGRPLHPDDLAKAPPATSRRFYDQLVDIFGQLAKEEFQHAGALELDHQGEMVVGPTRCIDLNTIQLDDTSGRQKHYPRQSSALEFALARYQILFDRLAQPYVDETEEDARHEVFALKDVRERLVEFVDNGSPFVLVHGDLRPTNIIVLEDLSIQAIIDWEWSEVVPRQFLVPPIWFAGHRAPKARNKNCVLQYGLFHEAAVEASSRSTSCRRLAEEWGEDVLSSVHFYVPSCLLNHDTLTFIYFSCLFPRFYGPATRQEYLDMFYQEDGPGGIFNRAVRDKMRALKNIECSLCRAQGEQ